MGSLSACSVDTLRRQYHCLHFIETGTGMAAGIGHARTFPFDSLVTMDIETSLCALAHRAFRDDPRIRIYNAESQTVLPIVLEHIPRDEAILFWLDAHFPGADYDIRSPRAEWRDHIRLPLETELKIIKAFRPADRDVILCDDLRIYLDGEFETGNIPEEYRAVCPRHRGIEFVYEIFGQSHVINLDFHDHGYLCLTPRLA
jgi:hypothetical protein